MRCPLESKRSPKRFEDEMFQGLRDGARILTKKPGFTLIAVLTLSLGSAANTALLRMGDVQAREAQSMPELPDGLDSPRLTALAREVKAGNHAAVQGFWEDVKGKIPLVETIPGNDQLRLVTFLWRGGPEARDLKCIGPPELEKKTLSRLAETDVWFLTARLPVAARFTYGFTGNLIKKRGIADPLNPLKFGYWSLVELPGAPPQPWIRIQPDAPKGALKQEKLSSAILKEERAVSVYTPAGYDPHEGPYGLLLLFDGEAYRDEIPTPTILDNLVASRKIHPLVALLVDSEETRDRDLQCSAPFADFLAKELLPWARQRYRFSADPKQTIVGGSSYGGLSAAYCAFRHPEVFGNVLSQSGSFGYYPGWDSDKDRTDSSPFGWLIRQFVTTRKLPIRFYLEAGLFETAHSGSILSENRRMRDVLDAKGYTIIYSEFAGGHEYLNWRGSLADGLVALAGREK
jgi:enterochelin esterase-like enzyme